MHNKNVINIGDSSRNVMNFLKAKEIKTIQTWWGGSPVSINLDKDIGEHTRFTVIRPGS